MGAFSLPWWYVLDLQYLYRKTTGFVFRKHGVALPQVFTRWVGAGVFERIKYCKSIEVNVLQ